MKISVVIPAYNEVHQIGACLQSVLAEVDRTPRELCQVEIIVVNNASSDGTKAAATRPRVTVVDETQKGIVFARAAGLAQSTGDLIANVDADTRMPVGWLTNVATAFTSNPQLVALSGPYIYYDISRSAQLFVKVFYFFGWLVYLINHRIFGGGGMLQGGNFVVRREALLAIGGYDTRIKFYGEDTDIARRIATQGLVWWTFSLPMYTSGRRIKAEGLIRAGYTYALNFVSTLFLKKPVTEIYLDHRNV